MNSPSLRYVMLKLYFPAAFLVAIILLILDAIAPPVVAQVRTVTVTVYVTITQQVYITLERTVMVTVATGIPTTLTSVMTSVVTSAVTSILTQTSLVSRLITETSVVSSLLTQTVSVQAPIRIGPLSLDLTDAGGMRFLGYTGGVAAAGFIGGALAARLGLRHRETQRYEVLQPRLPRAARARLPRCEIEVLRGKSLSGIPERILFEHGHLGWWGLTCTCAWRPGLQPTSVMAMYD